MKTFCDTIKIEENACPPDCSVCQERCVEVKQEIYPGCTGVKVIHIPEVNFHTAVICNQCAEPACAEVCPTGAITKSEVDGIVRIDEAECLGCGLCALACPYGGIHYDAGAKKAFKCDLCDGDPQCVSACPNDVISLIKVRTILQYLHEDQFAGGVAFCAGCPLELTLRIISKVLGRETIIVGTPSCSAPVLYGQNIGTWHRLPYYSCLMTGVASSATGLVRYYRKIGKDVTVVCFTGDGCAADVGFQPLSGAAERNENFIYICYDNEGYMNTGVQRSSTTPFGASTTTTPVGVVGRGKEMSAKNLPLIMGMHRIPYVATATMSHLEDFIEKLLKAKEKKNEGFAYIHVFSPCPVGWGIDTDSSIQVCRMAVRTNYFPLWEAERGRFRLTYTVATPTPITEYTKLIRKFRHLSEEELAKLQEEVNSNFAFLHHLTEFETPKAC